MILGCGDPAPPGLPGPLVPPAQQWSLPALWLLQIKQRFQPKCFSIFIECCKAGERLARLTGAGRGDPGGGRRKGLPKAGVGPTCQGQECHPLASALPPGSLRLRKGPNCNE